MNNCFNDNFYISNVPSHRNQTCEEQNHIPPNIPIYDGHIHLNQTISKLQSDLISVKVIPPIREFHFINNHHKPDEWFVSHLFPFSSHVHIYPTFGIHPKYFQSQSLYQTFNDLRNRLEVSLNDQNRKNKIVAVGECGLDETSMAPIEHQMFVLEKQIDLAIQFHLPIILHCRGACLYRKLFDCLKNRISDKSIGIHWHCINSNSNLHIVDLFLNEFPNSYIGINGSITYRTNTESSFMFENWLVNRSPFLPDRLILETDYPYLQPLNLHGKYDPSCALLATAAYLSKTINNINKSPLSYVESSNKNIKLLYSL